MAITAGAPPTRTTPGGLALGLLTGAVIGASLTAFIGGCAAARTPLIVLGLVLPTVFGLLRYLGTLPRRARERAVAPRTALAMIESLEAVGSEASDVPVRFDLTVAPDDAPAFRVEFRQTVNLVELPDYRPRGIVVVEYPPDRPWKMRIVTRPTPAWEERAARAFLDSAPGPSLKNEPSKGCVGGLLTLLGLLLGTGAVLLLFRADLFGPDAGGAARKPSVTSSSTFSSTSSSTTITTTVTSATGTVALGPGRSMLDEGELRRSVESLTQGADQRQALTVVVQDRLLTVVWSPAGVDAAGFDPRSLPFDRVAALVEEARTTLGIDSPRSWQLTADGVTGSPALRVTVTGERGTGILEADGQGRVLRRNGS
ncbi:hypothetical protein GCM10009639_17770 [Kitasatospora putterlickiae]|uniref:Uncharacterized protein n=1 Tax=Kitasatospora putterlickiae TaxID=221725 RepID=A0ABN1XTF2_9ACTN